MLAKSLHKIAFACPGATLDYVNPFIVLRTKNFVKKAYESVIGI
jgi:hypothetical protein